LIERLTSVVFEVLPALFQSLLDLRAASPASIVQLELHVLKEKVLERKTRQSLTLSGPKNVETEVQGRPSTKVVQAQEDAPFRQALWKRVR